MNIDLLLGDVVGYQILEAQIKQDKEARDKCVKDC